MRRSGVWGLRVWEMWGSGRGGGHLRERKKEADNGQYQRWRKRTQRKTLEVGKEEREVRVPIEGMEETSVEVV
jgi:hypothetical protein